MKSKTRCLCIAFALLLLAGCSGDERGIESHLESAQRFLAAGQVRRARARIGAAIAADPSRSATYYTAARIYQYWQRYTDEVDILETLIERGKAGKLDRKLSVEDKAGIYLLLGIAYQELGELGPAEGAFKDALALAPGSPQLLNALGYFYADNGIKLLDALKLTRRAVDLAPEDGAIVDSLGWAQYKLGDDAAALETLKRAVELLPDNAEVRYHLGAAYVKAGKKTAAWIELKKALVLDRGMEEAAVLLKTLQE